MFVDDKVSEFLLALNLRGSTVGWLVGWLVDGRLNRFQEFRKVFETSNGCLPLEDGSDRRETLGKRVSDSSKHFIFRRRIKIVEKQN